MKVEWFRNDGKPIPQGHRFRTTHDFGFVALDVLYAYPEDSGTYSARATNANGSAVTTAQIVVNPKQSMYLEPLDEQRYQKIKELERAAPARTQEPDAKPEKPVFVTALNNMDNVKESDHVHLECRLTPVNDPNLKVEWFVNGVKLKSGHRFRTTHDFGYVALDILYAYPEDSGTYIAKAVNLVGEAVNTCTVSVSEKKGIYYESQHPDGWAKISALESHKPGRAEFAPEVALGPPKITPLVGKKEILENSRAHFECRVEPSRDPKMKIEWFKDGQPLSAGNRFHTTFDFGYVALDVGQVVPEDSGNYRVRASNELGKCEADIDLRVVGPGSTVISDTDKPLEKFQGLENRVPSRAELEAPTFQRPVFTVPLENLESAENANVHFEARLIPVGDPNLKVEWFRNEVPVEESSRIKKTHDFGYVALDVQGARAEDSGTYIARAKNLLGEAVTTASLKVGATANLDFQSVHPDGLAKIQQLENKPGAKVDIPDKVFDKPVFTSSLTGPSELLEGQHAHYECRVVPIGDPTLTYEWFCNGAEIKMGTRYRSTADFGFVTLDISSVIPEDSGMYSIKVRNSAGEAINSISLKVHGKSSVQTEPMQPSSWNKIQDLETSPQTAVRPDQIVSEPPVFTRNLEEYALAENSTLHMEAFVEPKSDPKLGVQWFKNGVPLNLGSRMRTTFDFGLVTLDINGLSHLNNIEIEEGKSSSFACQVEPRRIPSSRLSGSSTVARSRRLRGHAPSLTLETLGSTSRALMVKMRATNARGTAQTTGTLKVIRSDKGVLDDTIHPKGAEGLQKVEEAEDALQAKGRRRSVKTPDIAVIKPWFEPPLPNEMRLKENQPLNLECRVEPKSDPDLKVEWFVNGKPVSGTRFKSTFDFGFVNLTLDDVHEKLDSGVYTAHAYNKHGEAFTSWRLEAALAREARDRQRSGADKPGQPPKFTTPFENLRNLQEGDLAHFEATLIPVGDETMKVEWFKDGKPIEAGHRIRTVYAFGMVVLEIFDCKLEDNGIYTARATNAYGKDEISTELECVIASERVVKPKFTVPLKNLENVPESTSVHFEATLIPVGDPNMVVEWFHNGEPLQPSSRVKTVYDFGFVVLDIGGVTDIDEGLYECRARNLHGSDRTQAILNLIKLHRGIASEPIDPDAYARILELEAFGRENQSSAPLSSCSHRNSPPSSRTSSWLRDRAPTSRLGSFPLMIRSSLSRGGRTGFNSGPGTSSGSSTTSASSFWTCSTATKRTRGSTKPGRRTSLWKSTAQRASLACSSKASLIFDPQIPKSMFGAFEKIRENAHLEARITPTDDPKLTIEWLLNGKPLRAGSRFKTFHDFGFVILEISSVYMEDSGNYECRAYNEFGEAVTTCSLVCSGKRSSCNLDSQLTRMGLDFDKIAKLEAQSPTNDPKMKIDWFHNGRGDHHGFRGPRAISRLRFVILEINGVTPRDQGHKNVLNFLFVLVTTHKHSVERARFVDGGVPSVGEADVGADSDDPAAARELPNWHRVTPEAGGVAVEAVEPVNDPTMRIEWYFNGKPIVLGSRMHTSDDFGFISLDLDWTFARDTGEYLCRAVNPWGFATTRAKLTCKGKRDIVLESQLPKGIDATRLSELERGPIKEQQPDNSNLPSGPPKFIKTLNNFTIVESEPLHLECTVEPKADPTMKVEWFHNGKPLKMGSRFHTVYDFGYVTLDILYTYEEDAGSYVCVATNMHGEDRTESQIICRSQPTIILQNQMPKGMKKFETLIQMEAAIKKYTSEVHLTEDDIYDPDKKQPPRFVTQIQSQNELKEMNATKFECQLSPVGDPHMKTSGKPSIVYDTQLPAGMHSIEKIREMEANWLRRKSIEESERAREAPNFVTKPDVVEVWEGDWAKFCCRVTGFPRPRVLWIVNGRTVMNGSRYKLTYDGMWHLDIPKTRQYDHGKVEVLAKNSLGEAYACTQLVVKNRHDDYRALLKNSPRPWYDLELKAYQDTRYGSDLEKIFAERLTTNRTQVHINEQGEYSNKIVEDQETEWQKLLKARGLDYQKIKEIEESQLTKEQKIRELNRQHALANQSSLSRTAAKVYDEKVDVAKQAIVEHAKQVSSRQISQVFKYAQKQQEEREAQQSHLANLKHWKSDEHTLSQEEQTKLQDLDEATAKSVEERVSKQTQKTQEGDLEITRKITETEVKSTESKAKVVEGVATGPFKVAPNFTRKIQPCRVLEKGEARFEVEFDGDPLPIVKWFRDDFHIQDSLDFQITTVAKRSTLVIQEVFMEDSGIFSVVAENPGGQAKCSANLVVEEPRSAGAKLSPPNFVKTLESVRTTVGAPLVLDCVLASGSKPIEDVFWIKDGKKLSGDVRIKITGVDNNYTLEIRDATVADQGKYEVVGLNSAGEARCECEVVITEPVALTKPKPESGIVKGIEPLTTANEGQSAVLSIQFAKFGNSMVRWTKNGKDVKQSRSVRLSQELTAGVTKCSIKFDQVFPEDEGEYTVSVVRNGNVIATSKGTLQIAPVGQPSSVLNLVKMVDVSCEEGDTATFQTEILGFQPQNKLKVQWFRENALIPESEDFEMMQEGSHVVLLIKSTYEEDSGTFTVRVSDIANGNQVESSARLTVKKRVSTTRKQWKKLTRLSSSSTQFGQKTSTASTMDVHLERLNLRIEEYMKSSGLQQASESTTVSWRTRKQSPFVQQPEAPKQPEEALPRKRSASDPAPERRAPEQLGEIPDSEAPQLEQYEAPETGKREPAEREVPRIEQAKPEVAQAPEEAPVSVYQRQGRKKPEAVDEKRIPMGKGRIPQEKPEGEVVELKPFTKPGPEQTPGAPIDKPIAPTPVSFPERSEVPLEMRTPAGIADKAVESSGSRPVEQATSRQQTSLATRHKARAKKLPEPEPKPEPVF
ncbi:Titin [Orchesella cincta]|uniref:Titin n=1 Tax=Orchesella cincta TaxID=48709 RepID=A0A1D2NG46_ORCCI|nr:Titin [Orchesella cincta]